MVNLKKLVFAPLFLLSFAYLCYLINPFLSSVDSILSLDLNSMLQPVLLTLAALVTALFFALFATLAQDWKYIGVVTVLGAIIPIIFLPNPLNLYLSLGLIICVVIIFGLLLAKLKTYLTFQPSTLLTPSIKNFATLLLLVTSILYFQAASNQVQQKGVHFFDPLIHSTLNIFNQVNPTSQPTQDNKALIQEKF